MIVTVSGKPGSGKSTLARNLAEHFGLEHHSGGEFMRQIAKEKGMSLLDLSAHAEDNNEIDMAIDARTQKFGREHDNFVMDSRLAWHFIPQSIKVFLDISFEGSARRIYKDLRHDEQENTSEKQTLKNIKQRFESEKKRYGKMYNLDYMDKKNFDIVIDTTKRGQEETFEKAVKAIEKIIAKSSK